MVLDPFFRAKEWLPLRIFMLAGSTLEGLAQQQVRAQFIDFQALEVIMPYADDSSPHLRQFTWASLPRAHTTNT